MSYELINKDLNMWSCSISDLTTEQVDYFLCQWTDGSSISSLTIFYEPLEDKLVINKDIAGFEQYLYIIKAYISLSYEQREEYKFYLHETKFSSEASKNSINEFLGVLDRAMLIRKIKKIDEILGKQSCQLDKVQEFRYIESKHKNESSNHWIMADAFKLWIYRRYKSRKSKKKGKEKISGDSKCLKNYLILKLIT